MINKITDLFPESRKIPIHITGEAIGHFPHRFGIAFTNPHFSYRFCCELPPSAPCGLLCEQAVSTSLRLLRPAPASFRPEFPLDSMFSYSSAGTARREIRSAR